jgi:EpsI family protein
MAQSTGVARFLAVVALLAGTALFLYARSHNEIVPQSPDLASFPLQAGAWSGREVVIETEVLKVLGPGQFLSRVYRREEEPYVDLFIAYFPSQRSGDTIHSPKNCLPGSGWTPTESSRIRLPRPGGTLEANRYIIGRGADRQLVLYWYQAHSRTVASEYWAKFYLVADAMRLNRTDGALVRVVTPIAQGEQLQAAEARALGFTNAVLPEVDRYIPR